MGIYLTPFIIICYLREHLSWWESRVFKENGKCYLLTAMLLPTCFSWQYVPRSDSSIQSFASYFQQTCVTIWQRCEELHNVQHSLLCLAGGDKAQFKAFWFQTVTLTIVFVFGCPSVLVLPKEKPVFCVVVAWPKGLLNRLVVWGCWPNRPPVVPVPKPVVPTTQTNYRFVGFVKPNKLV